MVEPKVINFNVRGTHFSMRAVDLKEHPDSYFVHLLKDEWNSDNTRVVDLDRDEEIFRYIHHYIYTCDLYSLSLKITALVTWLHIREDADFFNLGKLVTFCDTHMSNYIAAFVKSNQLLSNINVNYVCVEESSTQPTEEVLACMVPFYPPSIATCRLLTYPRDCLISANAATARSTDIGVVEMTLTNKQNYQHCVKKHGILAHNTLTALQSAFQTWPLDASRNTQLHCPSVYVYSVGGGRVNSKPDHDFRIAGVVLYIFNRAFTGGTITSTVNGQTVSINKPGECMALAAGASYSVDTVTSGMLLLVEFAVYAVPREYHPDNGAPPPPWIVYRPYEPPVYPDIIAFNKLQLCLNAALREYDGVVICLPRFYPIKYCADNLCKFVTDPDALTGKDGQLYDQLCTDFNVQVVSVYIGRVNNYSQVHNVHVLDNVATSNGAGTGDNHAVELKTESKLKVVSPMFGFGETFCCDLAPLRELVWGSVLTGLMVAIKK